MENSIFIQFPNINYKEENVNFTVDAPEPHNPSKYH